MLCACVLLFVVVREFLRDVQTFGPEHVRAKMVGMAIELQGIILAESALAGRFSEIGRAHV